MASGLTLVLGMMSFINLAHGSFYMIEAFILLEVVKTDEGKLIQVTRGTMQRDYSQDAKAVGPEYLTRLAQLAR
jgi:hypothetical protein